MLFRQHQAEARASTVRLLLLFGVVVLGLVVAVNAALALLFWLVGRLPLGGLTGGGLPNYFFETNTALVLFYVIGGWWVEWAHLHHQGDGAGQIAQMLGARPASISGNDELSRRERRLMNVVAEMALAARMPTPKTWVLPRDDAINALAAGWGVDDKHRDTAVIMTRGALERLSRDELQGVVAHELSHIQHGDTRLNMQLVGMVWGLQLLWSLGVSLSQPSQGRLPATAPIGWVLIIVGWLGWLAGRMLQAAVSRQREFLADATAVKSTRQISGLGGALRKIAEQAAGGRGDLVSGGTPALAHLFLASPFELQTWAALRPWLATHPSLPERLHRIYGHEVLPMDDAVVPLVEDDPPGGLTALASLATPAPTVPYVRGRSELAHAQQHDAYQNPSHFSVDAEDADAMQRMARWGGPGEWQAAMLALCAPTWSDETWQAMTNGLPVAASVRLQVAKLSPAARRWARSHFLQKAAQQPLAARLSLLRSWSRRLRPYAKDPAILLRALAARHALAPTGRPPCGGGTTSLAASVYAATEAFACTLPLPEPEQQRWRQAAEQALAAAGFSRPVQPTLRGLAPMSQLPGLTALRVRRLSAMQKPLLIKAWLAASEVVGVPAGNDDGVADALHWACLGLGLPTPAAVRVAAGA